MRRLAVVRPETEEKPVLPKGKFIASGKGPEGQIDKLIVDNYTTVKLIQQSIGMRLKLAKTDWELIDISIGDTPGAPLDPAVIPFAHVDAARAAASEEYHMFHWIFWSRIHRLLKKSKLKGVGKKSRFGRTALHFAVGKGELLTCREILDDLDFPEKWINARDVFNDTPLMLASTLGNLKMVKILLDARAQVDPHRNQCGRTALMLASEQGHHQVVEALLNYGAHFKHTPMDMAANWRCQRPIRTSAKSLAKTNNRKLVLDLLDKHEDTVAKREKLLQGMFTV